MTIQNLRTKLENVPTEKKTTTMKYKKYKQDQEFAGNSVPSYLDKKSFKRNVNAWFGA